MSAFADSYIYGDNERRELWVCLRNNKLRICDHGSPCGLYHLVRLADKFQRTS